MTLFSNYHTHTSYCDGKNTVDEMIRAAIDANCPEIGFSGHSYTDFDTSWCMSKENTEIYFEQVTAAKEKYRTKIRVLCGIEQDYYSDMPTDRYDFVIGSVHYVHKENEYIPVDESAEIQTEAVNRLYGGDFYAFAEDYFALVSDLRRKTNCNIVGHFDVISKFNENGRLYDENCDRYIKAGVRAIEHLAKSGASFEINTGAISRNYRQKPYPSEVFLPYLKKYGVSVVLSSDAHATENLLFGFDDALKTAERFGLTLKTPNVR